MHRRPRRVRLGLTRRPAAQAHWQAQAAQASAGRGPAQGPARLRLTLSPAGPQASLSLKLTELHRDGRRGQRWHPPPVTRDSESLPVAGPPSSLSMTQSRDFARTRSPAAAAAAASESRAESGSESVAVTSHRDGHEPESRVTGSQAAGAQAQAGLTLTPRSPGRFRQTRNS